MLLLTVTCFAILCSASGTKLEEEPATSVHHVEAVLGKVAKLPCDIQPTVPNDKVHIVIWFQKEKDKWDPNVKEKLVPIFSLDARNKPIDEAIEWKDEKILGQRATFRYKDHSTVLVLNSVREDDEAVYFCRVDFRQTPTRNIKVNLTVIVPPEKLKIIHGPYESHIKDYKLGPFTEGSSINITCEATGGRPLPKVTWWLENTLLDESMEYVVDSVNHQTVGKVRNVLHIENVNRRSLNAVYTCQASNSRLIHPISSTITLDLNLKPLWVKLLGKNKPLSANRTYELECEVVGSRPQPTITWWKGSVQMENTRETTSPDGNVTTSVLTFVPRVEDSGKYLSCRGQQSLIQGSGTEDGWKLNIYHVPLVSLELGSNLNGSIIKEGADVYFECNIKSNPWVYKISWRHNGQQLFNNVAAGTIVSNQSLVLQSVTASKAGYYTCVAHNQEGDGESNPIFLDVKFLPHCRPGQTTAFAVAREEIVKIVCEVNANPIDVEFIWKLNNSLDVFGIPPSQVYSEKTRSVALFKPITEKYYGHLLCWGRNEVGIQDKPCVYHITEAEEPDAPSNCTVANQTPNSIWIECAQGSNGSLAQEFVMEVYDASAQPGKLVSNVTTKVAPSFSVAGLESNAAFDVTIYAVNKKGKSPSVRLAVFTLKRAEKRTAITPSPLQLTPIVGALVGVVVTVIFLATVVVLVIRLRERKDKLRNSTGAPDDGSGNSGDKTATEPQDEQENDTNLDSLEENNPDLIPQNNPEYEAEERAFARLNQGSSIRPYCELASVRNPIRNDGSTYEGMFPYRAPINHLQRGDFPSTMLDAIKHRQEPIILSDQQRMPPPPQLYALRTIDRHRCNSQDESINLEIPLLSDNNIPSLVKGARDDLARAPLITGNLQRSATSTRF